MDARLLRAALGVVVGGVLVSSPVYAQTVNSVVQFSSTTGHSPNFIAQGPDANIGIILTPLGTGTVGIGTTSPQSLLQIYNGEVQVGSSGASCAAANAGAIRFSGSAIYYCNGTSWVIDGSGAAAGSTGYVQFNGGSGAFAADSNFFWDNTNKRLGIGTATPNSVLNIAGDKNGTSNIDNMQFVVSGATTSTKGITLGFDTTNNVGVLSSRNVGVGSLPIEINGSSIYSSGWNGNVGIGTTSPAYLLDVKGASVFRDIMRFGGTSNIGVVTWNGVLTNTFNVIGDVGKNLSFGSNGIYDRMFMGTSGNVGIGTTTPTNILSLSGSASQTFWMERNPTASTAGNSLTVEASGAASGGTNLNGGNLVLSSGIATGTGSSNIQFQTANADATGTTDRSPATAMTILGNGSVGIGTTSPTNLLTLAPSDGGGISLGDRAIAATYYIGRTGAGALAGNTTSIGFSGAVSNAGSILYNANSGNHIFTGTNGGGNVGIGTTAPLSTLDVRGLTSLATTDYVTGSAGSLLQLYKGAATGNTYSALQAYTTGGLVYGNITLNALGGSVGIGTTSPTNLLNRHYAAQ
jgi:hypothetical protein